MANWTHTFSECGNGFPRNGEDVLEVVDGDVRLLTVVETSPIHTAQWAANMVYVVCEESDNDWDDYSEDKQTRLYEDMHHVEPVADDEPEDVTVCPKCGGDPMLCECVTQYSQE